MSLTIQDKQDGGFARVAAPLDAQAFRRADLGPNLIMGNHAFGEAAIANAVAAFGGSVSEVGGGAVELATPTTKALKPEVPKAKKKGGLFGKIFKFLQPILKIASFAVNLIPGIGQLISVGLNVANAALEGVQGFLETGKLKLGKLLGGLASSILPGGLKGLFGSGAVSGLLGGLTKQLASGKIGPESLGAAFKGVLGGLPLAGAAGRAVEQGVKTFGNVLENGKLDVGDVVKLLGSAARLGPAANGPDLALSLAARIDSGDQPLGPIVDGLRDLVVRAAPNEQVKEFLLRFFDGVRKTVEEGNVRADEVARAALGIRDGIAQPR